MPIDNQRAADCQDQFLALLEAHKKILYKVAYTYCRDPEDRRDLMQEMIIQLWRGFDGFDGRVLFSTWMYRVAMNVAISHYRHESTRIRDGRGSLPLEEIGIDIAAADAVFAAEGDNLRALRTLINQMDEMNRALILLFLEGFSHEEIAATLGMTATNVATRLNRIKVKLQAEFAAA